MNQLRPLASQRGLSIFRMVVLACVIGFVMLLGARVFPAINEYLTIRKVVSTIMKNQPAGPDEIRTSFERSKDVEYSIKTISSKDLVITPVGDHWRTAYDYSVEVPVYDPTVFLLLKFSGSASSGGGTP
jgi:hypothetical protein